jgi:ATP-dependent Clp protease ATP-binding subunit ClpA
VEQSHRRVGPFRSGAGFRQALARSRDEAFLRYHRQIRPGHILLAVANTSDVRVDAILATLGIARLDLARRAAAHLAPSLPPHDGGPDLAYTPRGVHVVEQAARIAERLAWGWLGAAHLLIALGEEDWGSPPRVFREVGVTPAALHSALAAVVHSIPPPMSDEAPIYWWDRRATDDAPGSYTPAP